VTFHLDHDRAADREARAWCLPSICVARVCPVSGETAGWQPETHAGRGH
jgi:hypothetical protein